MKYPFIRL
ncbi:hypothetical protein FOXB_13630 [Fusarium oxysporum f. sp. conglutinans Fo5176]|uniref:Uncharacterized protein n=1 Tax=Fusarium oxysporum (strain Fo5176) TaxID=660025 RepID=F9G4P8_FUSOF|nr:hypothetical protein FOXB_13630 [Fusarium oxysporum f. sp. conglutinans Fo5176]